MRAPHPTFASWVDTNCSETMFTTDQISGWAFTHLKACHWYIEMSHNVTPPHEEENRLEVEPEFVPPPPRPLHRPRLLRSHLRSPVEERNRRQRILDRPRRQQSPRRALEGRSLGNAEPLRLLESRRNVEKRPRGMSLKLPRMMLESPTSSPRQSQVAHSDSSTAAFREWI